MLFPGLRVYKDVVYEHLNSLMQQACHYLRHCSLHGSRGIGKAHGHSGVLQMLTVDREGCFLHLTSVDKDHLRIRVDVNENDEVAQNKNE